MESQETKRMTRSFRLHELPVEVIASHIMPMLDIRDLVALDCARAWSCGVLHQEVKKLMPPLELPYDLDKAVARWLLAHGYGLKSCMFLYWSDGDTVAQRELLNDFAAQFHSEHLRLPNKHTLTGKFIRRCTTVYLAGLLTAIQMTEFCTNALNVTELSVTDAAIKAHPELLSHLPKVVPKLANLSCSWKSLHSALPSLAKMGTKLKRLYLKDYTADIDVNLITEVASLCPYIEHLGIEDYSVTKNELSADAVVLTFAAHCHNLKGVSVDSCQLSTPALRRLLVECRRLTVVTRRGTDWSAEDILTIAECGAEWADIPLHCALLGNLETYRAFFANLQSVQLIGDFLVSPSAAAAVSCMTALDSVSLFCNSAVGPGGLDVSAVLRAVTVTCRQLRKLSCTGPYNTDVHFATALAAVITNCIHLSHLDLKYEGTTTVAPMPQVLADAFTHSRRWVWLAIECYNVAECQLLPVVISLRWLVIFTLPKAADLTDAFLSALAQHCRDLAWLRVNSSALLTEPGLLQLMQRCRKLSHLELHRRSMSATTADALAAARRLYKLKVVVCN
jgi:hypothetical protein